MIFPNYYFRYNPFYNQQRNNIIEKNNHNIVNNSEKISEYTSENYFDNKKNTSYKKRISPKYNYFNLSNLLSSNLKDPVLEIFGIELYFDDILILGLLLFLYREGVKDEMLFICLILLLLT